MLNAVSASHARCPMRIPFACSMVARDRIAWVICSTSSLADELRPATLLRHVGDGDELPRFGGGEAGTVAKVVLSLVEIAPTYCLAPQIQTGTANSESPS